MPCLRHSNKVRGRGPSPSPYTSSKSPSVDRDAAPGPSSESDSPSGAQLKFSKKPTLSQSHARKREAGYIKRPSNAFILFRTDFVTKGRIPSSIESHSQNLSRIAGEVWRSLSAEEKAPWMRKAQEVKEEHRKMYPEYAYHPTESDALKGRRKVMKGRGERELSEAKRKCRAVADLVKDGTQGEELEKALLVEKLRDAEEHENLRQARERRKKAVPVKDDSIKMDPRPGLEGVYHRPTGNKYFKNALRQKGHNKKVPGCWEPLRIVLPEEDYSSPGNIPAAEDLDSDSDSSSTCPGWKGNGLRTTAIVRPEIEEISELSSPYDQTWKSNFESQPVTPKSGGYTYKSYGVPVLVLPNTYIPPGHSLNEYLPVDPYGFGGKERYEDLRRSTKPHKLAADAHTEKAEVVRLPSLASIPSIYSALDWAPTGSLAKILSSKEGATGGEGRGSQPASIPTSNLRTFPGALRVPEKPQSCTSTARVVIEDDPTRDTDNSKSSPQVRTCSHGAPPSSPAQSSSSGHSFPSRSIENRNVSQATRDMQTWSSGKERWTLRRISTERQGTRSMGSSGFTTEFESKSRRTLVGGSESAARYSRAGGVGSPRSECGSD